MHEYLSKLPASSPFKIRQSVLDTLLISKGSFWLPGFMSGLALFVEEKRRRPELAMYVLPKALESAWTIGRGKVGVLKGWKGGEGVVSTIWISRSRAMYSFVTYSSPHLVWLWSWYVLVSTRGFVGSDVSWFDL